MNKKKALIIGGVALAVVVVAVILAFILGGEKTPIVNPPESETTGTSSVVIEEPGKTDDTPSGETTLPEIEDDGSALKPDETIETEGTKNPGKEAEKDNTPVVEAEPPKEAEPDNNGGGIQIGGNPPVEEKYNCGGKDHHCQNAGFHATLLNRELEGCPYCGSHSCASFYAVNEWGYTKYDPALCPKYNEKEDPAEYCPDCKRKMWSQDNPTGCFRYLQDTQCECGEFVPGNTCHHH